MGKGFGVAQFPALEATRNRNTTSSTQHVKTLEIIGQEKSFATWEVLGLVSYRMSASL